VLITSYAKINLFLEVTGKLPDGYHQINTVFCSIDLFDQLRFALTKTPAIELLSNLPEMQSMDNLIVKVAHYLRDLYKPREGVSIYLDKKIPIAAGLGGGSSNAAMTIIGLNRLWDLNLSISRCEEIATVFGSDISYFLHGGTAIGKNRGELLEAHTDILFDHVLLVKPKFGISAAEAYRACQIPEVPYEWTFPPGKPLFNRLTEGVCGLYPVIAEVLDILRHNGAVSAEMSGSGSTCFGIFRNEPEMDECAQILSRKGFWICKTRTISKEEYQECFQN